MFLLKCFGAEHEIVHDQRTLPGSSGLNLVIDHFDGYSPVLDGSVRTKVIESFGNDEKSGSITVTIVVRASSPSYKNNIRINQQDSSISISTGGLSLLSYASKPCLYIDVEIALPHSLGDLDIKTHSIPVFIQAIERANDVVIHTDSSPISVAGVEARSLTVSSSSGSIKFEDASKQVVEKFTRISNSSGSTNLRSSIFSPSLTVASSSGSVGLNIVTTAEELEAKNSSGSIRGEVDYVKGHISDSKYENSSGSTNILLRGWSGYLTARSSSGSKHVVGHGVERWNDGWRKGSGKSTAAFVSEKWVDQG